MKQSKDMIKKYTNFIFFSAGPVGDHVVLLDVAQHFYEATGVHSTVIEKHPNPFLRDLTKPYKDILSTIEVVKKSGYLRFLCLLVTSIWKKNCYVLYFPIPLPAYMKFFVYYIRFCTRSRVIGFNLEGSRSFPVGKGYASILGMSNCITMLPEMFYKSSNRLLLFLGYKPLLERVPVLRYVPNDSLFVRNIVTPQTYIAFHICASTSFRTLPVDRWNKIISTILERSPDISIVLTGSVDDLLFRKDCTKNVDRKRIIITYGGVESKEGVTENKEGYKRLVHISNQELLSLYANAKLCVSVQTGNSLIINMLHVPTVMINIKGTAMFYYHFNKNLRANMYSTIGCTCDPFETLCTHVHDKGVPHAACLFNIKDEDIVETILKNIHEEKY